MFTYPVFLLAPVLRLADAHAVACIADGLIVAQSHRLPAQVGKIAAHLRCHGSQVGDLRPDQIQLEGCLLLVLRCLLWEVQLVLIELQLHLGLMATKWGDWQL